MRRGARNPVIVKATNDTEPKAAAKASNKSAEEITPKWQPDENLPPHQSLAGFKAPWRMDDLKNYHCKRGDIRVTEEEEGITIYVQYGKRGRQANLGAALESKGEGLQSFLPETGRAIEKYRIAPFATQGCFRTLLEAKNDKNIYFLRWTCMPGTLMNSTFQDGDTVYVEEDEWRVYG